MRSRRDIGGYLLLPFILFILVSFSVSAFTQSITFPDTFLSGPPFRFNVVDSCNGFDYANMTVIASPDILRFCQTNPPNSNYYIVWHNATNEVDRHESTEPSSFTGAYNGIQFYFDENVSVFSDIFLHTFNPSDGLSPSIKIEYNPTSSGQSINQAVLNLIFVNATSHVEYLRTVTLPNTGGRQNYTANFSSTNDKLTRVYFNLINGVGGNATFDLYSLKFSNQENSLPNFNITFTDTNFPNLCVDNTFSSTNANYTWVASDPEGDNIFYSTSLGPALFSHYYTFGTGTLTYSESSVLSCIENNSQNRNTVIPLIPLYEFLRFIHGQSITDIYANPNLNAFCENISSAQIVNVQPTTFPNIYVPNSDFCPFDPTGNNFNGANYPVLINSRANITTQAIYVNPKCNAIGFNMTGFYIDFAKSFSSYDVSESIYYDPFILTGDRASFNVVLFNDVGLNRALLNLSFVVNSKNITIMDKGYNGSSTLAVFATNPGVIGPYGYIGIDTIFDVNTSTYTVILGDLKTSVSISGVAGILQNSTAFPLRYFAVVPHHLNNYSLGPVLEGVFVYSDFQSPHFISTPISSTQVHFGQNFLNFYLTDDKHLGQSFVSTQVEVDVNYCPAVVGGLNSTLGNVGTGNTKGNILKSLNAAQNAVCSSVNPIFHIFLPLLMPGFDLDFCAVVGWIYVALCLGISVFFAIIASKIHPLVRFPVTGLIFSVLVIVGSILVLIHPFMLYLSAFLFALSLVTLIYSMFFSHSAEAV